MAAFPTVGSMVDAENNGATRIATWRKSPTQTTTIGIWFDLSMSPGNPAPQYYAASPLVATVLAQSTDGGLYHSGNVSPLTKVTRKVMALTTTATALPMPMRLCDYLLYYPFVDEGTTDEQVMINSSSLTRYTDGAGVQIMAVSVAARGGGQSFYVTYTNSDGVSGRTSRTVVENAVSVTGSIVTTNRAVNGAAGPFIPLQDGDTGVRSIESVTMSAPDVGLFTLVLVKPLGQMMIQGRDAPVEVDYFKDFGGNSPIIKDDAYLNFICCPSGSLAATAIHGYIQTVWN